MSNNSIDYSAYSGRSKWQMKQVTNEDLSRMEIFVKVCTNLVVQWLVWHGIFFGPKGPSVRPQ